MTDLITELCQITAEILQNNPQGDITGLVTLVKNKIDTNLQLSEAIQNDHLLNHINQGDANKLIQYNQTSTD